MQLLKIVFRFFCYLHSGTTKITNASMCKLTLKLIIQPNVESMRYEQTNELRVCLCVRRIKNKRTRRFYMAKMLLGYYERLARQKEKSVFSRYFGSVSTSCLLFIWLIFFCVLFVKKPVWSD